MTEKELDTVMTIVSKELSNIQGGTREVSRDEFRRTVNNPSSRIRTGIIDTLGVKVSE